MDGDDIEARVAEAARSFDAELHTPAYAAVHSDAAQLERLLLLLSPAPGETILDLGTGNGYVAMAIARTQPASRVVGLDVAFGAIARNVDHARERGLANATFLSYDGVELPFPDGRLDAAVSRYAFHHLPRPRTTLAGLARAVRRGGRLVLADAVRDDADDVDFINRFQAMKRDGHVRMHRRADLIDLVCHHGFDVSESFESALAFTRERSEEYDRLLAETPRRVLRAYAVAVGGSEIGLRLRISNTLFVNRWTGGGHRRGAAGPRARGTRRP